MRLSTIFGSRADAMALAPCRNAWLCCHLSIIGLALILPEGRVGAVPRPFSLVDVMIVACITLFIVAMGIFHGRGPAALRLAGFWAGVVLTLILVRRVTPEASPVMAVVFMLACLARWRLGVPRRPAAMAATPATPAAPPLTPSIEPPKAARDKEAVAQMVHDLRSPLSAVLALVEKQGSDKAGAVQHDFLRSVRDQVQYGLSVAQHFMQLSRAERLERARFLPVSLQDLGQSAADQVFPLADKKGISICVEEGSEPLWVSGDYCMLLRAVVNLLENAIKYSAAQTRVTVGMERQGNAARLYVADQGVGIPAEALPRLCQAFYRAAGARKLCQDGVGMGLAIVAAVAKGHGAEVMVKSRPGMGSTFILTLPLLQVAAHDAADPEKPDCAAQDMAIRLE